MKVEDRSGGVERQVLIDCITSTEFMARTDGKLGKDPFRSKYANAVFGWCLDHFRKYNVSPGKQIESLFSQWSQSANKDDRALVERFLASLSGEYDKQPHHDVAFSLDRATTYFNEVLAERLRDEVTARLEAGKSDLAVKAAESFRPVQLSTQRFIDVLADTEAQRDALAGGQKVLIKWKGDAAKLFGEEFSEDSFVGVMAQVKGGKSFTLLHIGWEAMRQGRRVAYFQVGDMSERQVMARFLKRAAYRPIKPGVMRYPVKMMLCGGEEKGRAVVEHDGRQYDEGIDWNVAKRAFAKHCKKSGGRIRLSWHAMGTVNALQIRSILEGWDRSGWRAEVVVIDYAANMAPVDPRLPKHEQVDMTWGLLRQISQLRNCCVVTASQTNREGFRSWVLTRNNFRDSLMILGHVTSFFGINVTEEEKHDGTIRYNAILKREDDFRETQCLFAAHCLAISHPMILTKWEE